MRAYYALVDDLVSEEEFEELLLSSSGGLTPDHDSHSAAAAAAGKLGRLHTKIADIKKGPTLTSFYCRIIDRYLPPESEASVNFPDELNSGSEYPGSSGQDEESHLFSSYSQSFNYSDGGGRYVNTSSESYHSNRQAQKSRLRQNLSGRAGKSFSESGLKPNPRFSPEFPNIRLMLLCGDETGEVIVHFRDEMASAVMEVPAGSVLEVAGRYKSSGEVYAVDLRLSDAYISPREDGQKKILCSSVDFVILGIKFGHYGDKGSDRDYRHKGGGSSQFHRGERNSTKCGSITGEYSGCNISGEGDNPLYFRLFCGRGTDTFTITFRDFSLPEDISEGTSAKAEYLIRIPSASGDLRFSAGRKSTLIPAYNPADFTYSSPSQAKPGHSASFICRLLSVGRVHQFYSVNGSVSCVRNLVVADYESDSADSTHCSVSDSQGDCTECSSCGPGLPSVSSVPDLISAASGEPVCRNVVLWGDNAEIPVSEGEIIEIVNGFAKIPDNNNSMYNSCGGCEIHAGVNSLLRVVTSRYCTGREKISFYGVVIETASGLIIENGSLCYVLSGRTDGLCNGMPAEVSGSLYGMRIDVDNFRINALSKNNICSDIVNLLSESQRNVNG
ncbi:hypothetical protein [Methanoplanus endosymbiosus]|uniref:Uncharacterized protein n=1 Tax=Methanoplanus endosymbiosus TaxID=33865 RepID=A0A9E7TJC5_9EURY|nr:hypothetical protein [Methanoplanus endosymbiosus]UUX93493.1 hypothetical protein L6E24_05085 [Methanoplanus endosymbiosus]